MKTTSSVLAVLGSFLLVPQVASAQQPFSGTVLGIESIDLGCRITLSGEEDPQVFTLFEDDLCEQVTVGQIAEFTYSVTDVSVLPSPEVATVTEVATGDRACYVTLVDANGTSVSQLASFEVCAQDILNREVALTYGTGNVLAFACGGNVDCGESEEAVLITQAEPTGNPPTPAPEATSPEPDDSAAEARSPISELPDGNYRLWSGTPSGAIVSDDELLASGGVTFTFSKRGQNVAGNFAYIDGESICVQGQANGDTVTGISVQRNAGVTRVAIGETFQSFGPGDFLNVRRARQTDGSIRYDSTILNLEGLNRINAGTQLPPERC